MQLATSVRHTTVRD